MNQFMNVKIPNEVIRKNETNFLKLRGCLNIATDYCKA